MKRTDLFAVNDSDFEYVRSLLKSECSLNDTALNATPFGKKEFTDISEGSSNTYIILTLGKPSGIVIAGIFPKDRKAALDFLIDMEDPVRKATVIKNASGLFFNDLGLTKVTVKLPSDCELVRELEISGFEKEAVLREALFRDGRFIDIIVMSMTFDERTD